MRRLALLALVVALLGCDRPARQSDIRHARAEVRSAQASTEQRLDRLSAELAKLNRPYVGLRDRETRKCTRTGPVEAVQLLHDPRWRLDDTC